MNVMYYSSEAGRGSWGNLEANFDRRKGEDRIELNKRKMTG